MTLQRVNADRKRENPGTTYNRDVTSIIFQQSLSARRSNLRVRVRAPSQRSALCGQIARHGCDLHKWTRQKLKEASHVTNPFVKVRAT